MNTVISFNLQDLNVEVKTNKQIRIMLITGKLTRVEPLEQNKCIKYTVCKQL